MGSCFGMLGFIANVGAWDPQSRVFVVGPPVDCRLFRRLQSPDLANLGFGNAPDSIGEVLSTVLAEADRREHAGEHGPMAAPSGSTNSNGRQK